MSVAVDPGEIVLTVIECGASSSAMHRAAWMIAAFEAEYAVLFEPHDAPPDDRREEDDPAGDPRCHEVPCAGLGGEHRGTGVYRERPIPLVGRQLEKGRRRQHARGVDEDVEPAVLPDDVGDEAPGLLDLGEIGGVGRGARPEPLDRGLELAARQVDAGHPRAGADERLGARQPDAPLRAGDQRDTPVEPPRSGSRLRSAAHRSPTIASISTGMSNGRCGTPTDVRAPRALASVEVDDQVGEAVDHGRMLGEAVDGVDVAVDLQPARDHVEPTRAPARSSRAR